MPKWNPDQYERFIKDRTQPAIDLANRLNISDPKNILDLGCGPGNSTTILKEKFPCSKVIGADNSDEMLEKARSIYPEIEFIKLDANGDFCDLDEKFDILFSNACIQWLPDHHKLLPKLFSLLKTEGVLAVQIPMQREHPVHQIINELIHKKAWNSKVTARQYNNLSSEEYFDVLSSLSDEFEIWETTYCHRMPDYESIIEWYKGTGLRPYLEQLSKTDSEIFIGDFLEQLKQKYKVQENGEIVFRFPRLFFIVKNTKGR